MRCAHSGMIAVNKPADTKEKNLRDKDIADYLKILYYTPDYSSAARGVML